ncbi:MAG: hypothetical protein HFJ41_03675 [Clostridia bacterium]|nr:hypothetical protein [Clostridia bacterium]
MTEKQKAVVENELILLNINDVAELTGWCTKIVRDIFTQDAEFPTIKKGKEYQVEYSAFKNYLSKRRTNKKEE